VTVNTPVEETIPDLASHGAQGAAPVPSIPGAGGSQRTDLVVTFHVIGTAIGERRAEGCDLDVSPRIELRKGTLSPHVLGGSR